MSSSTNIPGQVTVRGQTPLDFHQSGGAGTGGVSGSTASLASQLWASWDSRQQCPADFHPAPSLSNRQQRREQERKEDKALRDKALQEIYSRANPVLNAAEREQITRSMARRVLGRKTEGQQEALSVEVGELAQQGERKGVLQHIWRAVDRLFTPPGAMAQPIPRAPGSCSAGENCVDETGVRGPGALSPLAQLEEDLGPRFAIDFNQPRSRLPVNSLNHLDVLISCDEQLSNEDLSEMLLVLKKHVKKGDMLITEDSRDWRDRPSRNALFQPINGVKWTTLSSGHDQGALAEAIKALDQAREKILAFLKRHPPQSAIPTAAEWRAMSVSKRISALELVTLQLSHYELERYGGMQSFVDLITDYNEKHGRYTDIDRQVRTARGNNIFAAYERGSRQPRTRYFVLPAPMVRDCGQALVGNVQNKLAIVTRSDLPLPVSADLNPGDRYPIEYLVKRYSSQFMMKISPSLQQRPDRSLKGVLLVFGDVHGSFKVRMARRAMIQDLEQAGDRNFVEQSHGMTVSDYICDSMLNPCVAVDHAGIRNELGPLDNARQAAALKVIDWFKRHGGNALVFDDPDFLAQVRHGAHLDFNVGPEADYSAEQRSEIDALIKALDEAQNIRAASVDATIAERDVYMASVLSPLLSTESLNSLVVGLAHLTTYGEYWLPNYDAILLTPLEA